MSDAISTAVAKKKLRNLELYISEEQHINGLASFGLYLSECLNDEIKPVGFVAACLCATHDLQKGQDSFGKRIDNELTGSDNSIFRSLEERIPLIALGVFPREFAGQVMIACM